MLILAPVKQRLSQAFEIISYPFLSLINRCFVHLKRFDHPSQAKTDFVFRRMFSELLYQHKVTTPLSQLSSFVPWKLLTNDEVIACLTRLNIPSSKPCVDQAPSSFLDLFEDETVIPAAREAVKSHVRTHLPQSTRLAIKEMNSTQYDPPGIYTYRDQLGYLEESPLAHKVFCFLFTNYSPTDEQIEAYRSHFKDPSITVLIGRWEEGLLTIL